MHPWAFPCREHFCRPALERARKGISRRDQRLVRMGARPLPCRRTHRLPVSTAPNTYRLRIRTRLRGRIAESAPVCIWERTCTSIGKRLRQRKCSTSHMSIRIGWASHHPESCARPMVMADHILRLYATLFAANPTINSPWCKQSQPPCSGSSHKTSLISLISSPQACSTLSKNNSKTCHQQISCYVYINNTQTNIFAGVLYLHVARLPVAGTCATSTWLLEGHTPLHSCRETSAGQNRSRESPKASPWFSSGTPFKLGQSQWTLACLTAFGEMTSAPDVVFLTTWSHNRRHLAGSSVRHS